MGEGKKGLGESVADAASVAGEDVVKVKEEEENEEDEEEDEGVMRVIIQR